MRPTVAHIDKAALTHNLQVIRQAAPNSKVIAMVKANAYGHGLIQVAKRLPDVNAFGVACLSEALLLREANIKQDIILMSGMFTADELPLIAHHQLQIVIHSAWQIEILKHVQTTVPIKAWLKVDTGMNCLGFSPNDVQDLYHDIKRLSCIKQPLNLMSHFANAGETDNDRITEQYQRFYQCVNGLPGERSINNSAGLLKNTIGSADWVRPGIMLYGVSPLDNNTASDLNLMPVMTLKSSLIDVKTCAEGEYIGYVGEYCCQQGDIIGVVAVGYGDGYPWHAKTGTPVLVNNKRASIVGRISMDMLTVKLNQVPDAKVGDEVILWGEGLPIEVIAQHANTIPYEILCHLGQRVSCQFDDN